MVGKETEDWDPGTATNASIWPTTYGNPPVTITNTSVLVKGAPPDSNGNPQFLAFVVWNTNFVGHIWLVKKGAEGVNFKGVMLNSFAAQTAGHAGFQSLFAGNVDTDPPVPRGPGPTIDQYWIEQPELNNAKINSQTMIGAIENFTNFNGQQ
ncbi:MAG TPA: hypothetical protein VFV99_02605 [Kofleriaceae bacterium]|nr:hypothetical protein [Kofleriaceae bacterium]